MQSLVVTLAVMIVAAGPEARSKANPTPQEVRAAMGRSLPFLESEGVAWKETKGCTSCHHVPMMLLTHHEAERYGFTIDKGAVEAAESWALGQYLTHPEFMPTGQDKSFPRRGPGPGSVYLALGVGAAGRKDHPAAEALKKFSGHFAGMQEGDGSWAIKQSTPPLVDGDDVATLLILLAMDTTGSDAVDGARRKALEWLDRAPRRDENQPLALRAMVAARFGKGDEAQRSAARLRERQNEDGGWGQVEGRSSDALATGQALCALVAAGEAHDGPAIRRAWAFLLGSQKDEGSWLVKTRTPKGHDEIVTYYGTGWATLGLLRTLPPDEPGRGDSERAIAGLTKRGVEFTRDLSRPGSPVVSVNFLQAEGPVTDADLAPLEGMKDLQRLDLACRRPAYTDAGLAHVGGLTRLEMIRLSDGKVTDAGLARLKRLGGLRTLWLDGTKVTDAGVAGLGGLTRLHDLFLDQTQVTDAGLSNLGVMTELVQLGLKNTGVTDAGLVALHDLPLRRSLQSLYLAGLPISDAGLGRLKGFDRLTTLDLSDTRISDAGLASLHDLPALETLYLFDTRIGDAGLAHLAGMTRLKDLFLGGLPITDSGLAHLAGLKSLEWLDLDGTKVTDAGLAHLHGLTALRKVGLKGTGVSEGGVRRLREALPKAEVGSKPAG